MRLACMSHGGTWVHSFAASPFTSARMGLLLFGAGAPTATALPFAFTSKLARAATGVALGRCTVACTPQLPGAENSVQATYTPPSGWSTYLKAAGAPPRLAAW